MEGGLLENFFPLEPLECEHDQEWVTVENKIMRISESARKFHGSVQCDIDFVERNGDSDISWIDHIKLDESQAKNINREFY